MDREFYTTLTAGRIKVLLAHDGNYNHPVIERLQGLEILDEDDNVIKIISFPSDSVSMSFNVDEAITEENKDMLEFMMDMANYHNN